MSAQKVHKFRSSLKYSEGHRDFWTDIYRKAFPDYQNHMNLVGRSESQRRGMDVVLTLTSGLTLFIDEKLRPKTYDDILLEYISVDTTNDPGWIEKPLGIHYIAYAFRDTGICYMLDWPLLRSAWVRFGAEWKRNAANNSMGFRKVEAVNATGYKTLSIAVPIYDLQIAMDRCSVIQGLPVLSAKASSN